MKTKLPTVPPEALVAIAAAVDDAHPISNLQELGVNQRMINLFQTNGINDMKDLMNKTREELMSLQNFGEKQLIILFEALSKYHSLPEF